jgi:hypothetical protein
MLNPSISDAFLGFGGAVVGSLIAGFFVWRQTKTLLNGEVGRRDIERELEIKSIAAALLWEIDEIYRQSIRNVCRSLQGRDLDEIHFDTKSLAFRRFTVYEATASNVGLFDPHLVANIVGWYGTLSSYFDTFVDYGSAMDHIRAGQEQYYGKARQLLGQIRGAAEAFVAPTKALCKSLAARSGTDYKFDAP